MEVHLYNNNEVKEERQYSDQETLAFGVVLVVGAAWFLIDRNMNKIEWWYFRNFEEIYLGIYGVIVLTVMYLIYFLKSKTKDMAKRARLLFSFWNKKESNIKIVQEH